MLLEIVKRTPSWVFVLFFILLALGYFQSKDRTVRRGMVFILPLIMLALSFYGVLFAFGGTLISLAVWLAGILLAVVLGAKARFPRGASFSQETSTYLVPGSWAPLVLMLLIFFIRYAVNVILARQPSIGAEPVFIVLISVCYGILSGAFLARSLGIWRSARQPGNMIANITMHSDTPHRPRR